MLTVYIVQFGSTLQYGGGYPLNGYEKAHCDFNTAAGQGLHLDYHTYGLDWTPTYLAFRSFYAMDQYWTLIPVFDNPKISYFYCLTGLESWSLLMF
jgi:hypothetical protein